MTERAITMINPEVDCSQGRPPVFIPQIPAMTVGIVNTKAADYKNFIK